MCPLCLKPSVEMEGLAQWVLVQMHDDAFCACACASSCVWWVLVLEMALKLVEVQGLVAALMGLVQGLPLLVLVLVLVALLQELEQVVLGLVTGTLVVVKLAVAPGAVKRQAVEAMLVAVQE